MEPTAPAPLGARLCALLQIEHPILQAPMAGAQDTALALAVASAGGLGALPCAMLTVEALHAQLALYRARTARPVNLNFFCHEPPEPDPARASRWSAKLAPYYAPLGLDPGAPSSAPTREPFGEAHCAAIEALRPEVVSFHFGLPSPALLERVRATGAKVLSSATTVAEARELEARGCDAIIAQGSEAGGHRAMFLTRDVSSQPGLFALLPQVVDAVRVPVIAAGGIADARGVVAAFALGAAGVQVGTAYLRCPESTVSAPHRAALASARDDSTHVTNVFTGRPARGVANKLLRELGPLSPDAPEFPLAAAPIAPLRAAAERAGSGDFSPLWAGQSAALGRDEPAGELTRRLAREANELARALAR